ncbi:GNAT family N-acetyltransferase [Marinomonas mediterranea]|uniref:GNAT family N-acetyltransferase n=1 Tax=Marinomonas mediterranea TaxID=119864 RepID=UPI00234BCB63|nr:GNAT family N-acetyltransferase [Marinomonas mediterranea]WCN08253.1 GNAT family N-acetyltransferase [Marinomonas mediterranea]
MNVQPSHSHRHCILSLESLSDALRQFIEKTHAVEHKIILSDQSSSSDQVDVLPVKKAATQLGKTYGAVFLDWSQGANINALSIMAGTLQGGGLFVLHLGPDWLNEVDLDLARYLSWPVTPEITTSYFKHYIWQQLTNKDSPFYHSCNNGFISTSKRSPNSPQNYPIMESLSQIKFSALTSDQLALQAEVLAAQQPTQFVLCAKRGRGKSTALGSLIKQLQAKGHIAVCAPSVASIATLKAMYESVSQETLPFFAPDDLLRSMELHIRSSDNNIAEHSKFDYLIVDESAAIPVPMLKALQSCARITLFSTTNDGYEGNGRGFGLQFMKYLTSLPSPTVNLTLSTPIRWVENDAFEIWLDRVLFQSSHNQAITMPSGSHCLQGKTWLEHPELLSAAFTLLVNAHYQTSPDNIRWMLDDPSTFSVAKIDSNTLCSIAICTQEGELPTDLAAEVMQGKRRPRGHLLPQSLLAHEGIANAADYKYWRISRIATQPNKQNIGYGSELIQYIEQQARLNDIDFLCVSYALTDETLNFWKKNGFVPVRLGYSKDQASGSYSIMMVKALSDDALTTQTKWLNHFLSQSLYSLPLNLWDLKTSTLINVFSELPFTKEGDNRDKSEQRFLLRELERQSLMLFCNHHRPAATIRSSLLKAVQAFLYTSKLSPNKKEHGYLVEFALGKITEQDASSLGFSGKKDMIKTLKTTLLSLL